MDISSIVLPPEVPDHELIRCIGAGSYGQVWLARTQMGRFRAVKVVYGERFGNDERPFERELKGFAKYEPISRSHPGLVAILHFGRNEAEGYFYYVMELADDREHGQKITPADYVPRTLAADSRARGRLAVRLCVELGIALAEALQELHRHGLVHRDIKPSNIIFVNGAPKLADIGLIADAGTAKSYVGTEGFIPPEGPGSPQADIYSLGKVLYEISTGKDRTDFPRLPRDLAEANDKEFLELNEVLLKACHVDVQDRYRSAREMAADLLLLRSGESVRRLHRLERLVGRVKKAALATLIIAPVLVLGYLQVDYRHKKAAEIRQLQLGGHLADGTYALDRGDYSGSLSPFLTAAILDDGDPKRLRTHRLRLKQILNRCPKLEQMFFHQELEVDHAELSPSGELLLTAAYWGKAQLWDCRTGQPTVAPFGSGKALESASFSRDGKYVVTADQHGAADIWVTPHAQWRMKIVHPEGKLASAQFSPDTRYLITAGGGGVARIWDIEAGLLKAPLTGHTQDLAYAGYSADGRYILTAGRDAKAIVWETQTLAPIHRLPHEQRWVYHGDFSPDGAYVVTTTSRRALLWDLRTGERLDPELPHGDEVYAARFSPDGRCIVTACLDGIVRLWDVKKRQLLAVNPMIRHGERVLDASFSRDGRRVVVGCGDGTARIWDLAGGAALPEPAAEFYTRSGDPIEIAKAQKALPNLSLKGLASAPSNPVYPKYATTVNGRFVLELKPTGSNTFEFQAWDVQNTRAISPIVGVPWPESLLNACISDDGRRALLYSRKKAQLYDLRSGNPVRGPSLPGSNISGAAFSPDGKMLTLYGSSMATLWEVDTGKILFPIPPYEEKVRCVEFSRDSSKFVVCTTSDGLEKCFAEIWSPKTRSRLDKRLQHGDGVLMAAFSTDGQRLVTASEDFYATVWDAENGQQMTPSLSHGYQVRCASFSRDGEWLATASVDGRVHVWDATTRRPLTPPLTIPTHKPSSVRFVKGDTAVFVTSDDGGAWLWPLELESRPLQNLVHLYELVCGRGDFEANRFRTTPQERLKETWINFSRKNSEDFKVSRAEILAWEASR